MSAAFSEDDLTSLTAGIDRLRSSARRTLPMFLIGVLATLIAAGVALYYIFTLSNDLRETRADLQTTQGALAAARDNLAIALAALRDAQAAATAGPATPGTRPNAERIAGAISDVSRSQTELTAASASIKEAISKLPAATKAEQRPAPSLAPAAVGWFAVAGSYPLNGAGLADAVAQGERAKAAGLCAELWQTKISGNYALVIGSRADRRTAGANVARARRAGLANDAFAQPDREWTKLPQSADC